METNCDEVRAASPSTFTLSQGRNNRLSLLSGSSLAERTTSPPPSYDGHVSGSLDAHLPLTISNKGWSEIESVSKQFLAENLPGWTASMQESEERQCQLSSHNCVAVGRYLLRNGCSFLCLGAARTLIAE